MASKDHDWLSSVSDLMSALMIIFLFISIAYMTMVKKDRDKMAGVAKTYMELHGALSKDLRDEFRNDFSRWDAELIDSSNTIRFREPDVLFKTGSSDISDKFRHILNDFWPRYVKVLSRYDSLVEEVRIEGHTSKEWGADVDAGYLKNASLSQDRSFNVLSYCFQIKQQEQKQEWLINRLRANGLSYAMPIFVDGKYDSRKSRRVEFRVVTKTEDRIRSIVNMSER